MSTEQAVELKRLAVPARQFTPIQCVLYWYLETSSIGSNGLMSLQHYQDNLVVQTLCVVMSHV